MTKRRTPSGEEDFKLKGSVHFSPGRSAGRELGSLVHAMFEQVEWLPDNVKQATSQPPDSTFEPPLQALWKAQQLDQREAFPKAEEQVLRTLRSEACRSAFARPDAHSTLWRERPFDLVLEDGGWLSGVFDRVIIERDAAGQVQRVRIIDFKTDDAPSAEALAEKVASYRPQLELYREAAAKLTGVPIAQVHATLVFTRITQLQEVA